VNKINTKSNNSNSKKLILESEYLFDNINKSLNNNNKNRVFDKNNNNGPYIYYE